MALAIKVVWAAGTGMALGFSVRSVKPLILIAGIRLATRVATTPMPTVQPLPHRGTFHRTSAVDQPLTAIRIDGS
jgi:hypothetical protein